jgi:hypothetical protein
MMVEHTFTQTVKDMFYKDIAATIPRNDVQLLDGDDTQ